MMNAIQQAIENFLSKFWAKPSGGCGTPLSLEKIIRYESTHFLFSLFMGWLVFSLILTIFSSNRFKGYAPYIWNISFVSGLLASVTMHIFIDAFTKMC